MYCREDVYVREVLIHSIDTFITMWLGQRPRGANADASDDRVVMTTTRGQPLAVSVVGLRSHITWS